MKVNNEENWAQIVRQAEESGVQYNIDSVKTGRLWAEAMELRIAAGENVADIAKECFDKADQGLTWFQFKWVIGMLAYIWPQGEELRTWAELPTNVE